jgi:membrane-bound lytic murein transglycosylase C
VTRVFSSNKTEALNDINQLDPSALFERLRVNLPYEETRQYVVKVAGYRKQFVAAPSAPIAAVR